MQWSEYVVVWIFFLETLIGSEATDEPGQFSEGHVHSRLHGYPESSKIARKTVKKQRRSEDVRGPWTKDSSGPLPILYNLISLTPPPHTLLLKLCTRLYDFKYGTFNQYISHGIFGNFGPFDDAMGEMGAPLMKC